ncbi:MAG: hypothetical protein AB8F95_15630 [Bacteroidia bacterium]
MKTTFFALVLFIAVISSCKNSDTPDPGRNLDPGDATVTVTANGNETDYTGTAVYVGKDNFIDNTSRHKFDINLDGTDEKIILNIIYDNNTTDGEIETGEHECGRLTPNNSAQFDGRVAEFYFINSDVYKWVDNAGTVNVTKAESPEFTVSFDVSIINDVTGNFDRIGGSFVSKER